MSKKQQAEENKPTPEVIKEKVLTHLHGKYDEEFVPISFSESSWSYPYNQMYLYPKKGSKSDQFEARIVANKDGTYDITDAYFGILIAPEYAKVVSEIVNEIYQDFKFFISFNEGMYPDRLNKDTDISKIYNKDERFVSYSTVFVKEEAAKSIDTIDSLRKIAARMIEKKLVGDVSIYIVKNEKFDSITMDALNALNKDEYFIEKDKTVMIGNDLEILALE
ncbi:hypothetical protein M3201_14435 [Paenibacillus motobuensis]|uniref:hypothetical protein n=1 Tax=Paenibacillus TaxID=44249 RepID=UPI00203E4875|nr:MULTISPECIES: hypothetical protein [Paenibacillus]MCM3040897.1 hypothetical protein [Paenibacillus lutimineralis]MCM3648001.1 hypothetical protein [Paenibacillus motobuensis]